LFNPSSSPWTLRKIDHRITIRREQIADAQHIRPAKKHDAVAIGMRRGHVIHHHRLAVEQKILGRSEIRVIDAGRVCDARLSQLHQAIQDILMRDHARPFARVRRSAQPDQSIVSAHMIRIHAGVDHPDDRGRGNCSKCRHHLRRGRGSLRIHNDDAFFSGLDSGVAAGPHDHGHVSLDREDMHFLRPNASAQQDCER
jgi:hypothetical protein